MRPCETCGVALPLSATRRRRFCSTKCKNAAQRGLRKAWAIANPDKKRVIAARSRGANREKILAEKRSYREINAEDISRKMRAYYESHPERFAAARHRRRAHLRRCDSRIVDDRDWCRLVERYEGRCAYCGTNSLPMTRDHIIPISRGGRDAIGNLVPACGECNRSKGALLLVEWRSRRPSPAP